MDSFNGLEEECGLQRIVRRVEDAANCGELFVG